jgi:hypothetical protein
VWGVREGPPLPLLKGHAKGSESKDEAEHCLQPLGQMATGRQAVGHWDLYEMQIRDTAKLQTMQMTQKPPASDGQHPCPGASRRQAALPLYKTSAKACSPEPRQQEVHSA